MKRLDQLTFMRFAMVMLVLIYHGSTGIYTSFLNHPLINPLLRSAPTAVSYLYVLSGFVMCLVYFRPNDKFDFWGYWRTRFIRIYPLYIISFALTCFYYLDSLLRIKPQKILANIFVVQAWIPAYSQSFNYASWSMTVEFFFYAVFPFFIVWAYRQSNRKLIWLSVGLWVLTQVIHYTLWIGFVQENKEIIVYFPMFHLNSFILGVVGGIWYMRVGRSQKYSPWVVWALLAGSFLLVAGYTIVSSTVLTTLPHDLQPMSGLLAPIMILFIISLALDESRLSRILSHPALVTLGETSYAIYILHVPVVWLFERALESSSLADPRQIFNVVFLPMMIGLGLLAHFFVDTPLRRWLKKTLQRVSIPLLLLELLIFGASVFIVFRLRFGEGREYDSYRNMMRLIFWSAFILRTALTIGFGASDLLNLHAPFWKMVRPLLISITTGSLVIAGIAYAGYAGGWFENFPRSIFALDWLLVFLLSLGARFLFRSLKFSRAETLPA